MNKKVTIGRRPMSSEAGAVPQGRPAPEAVDEWMQKQSEAAAPPAGPQASAGQGSEPATAAPPRGGRERRKAKEAAPGTEPEPMKRLTIDIPVSLHRRVKSLCGAEGLQIANVVRGMLEKRFPSKT